MEFIRFAGTINIHEEKKVATIMNHGTASIFTALRENTNGAQDTFISEIVRIIDKYPWCSEIGRAHV